MTLFSDNIDDGAARSRTLVPFIGGEMTGRLHRCDTGGDDNGTAYAAQIRTKPYSLRSMLQKFEVLAGVISAKATSGAKIAMQVIRDFGLESTSTVSPVLFDASAAGETDVIKFLDDLTGAEMSVAQFDFADTSPAGTGRWELNYLALAENEGQRLAGER